MHVRVSKRRRGDKVYRYVQLVQSYRREDGMPAHKVLASLGDLSDQETENLKLALKAAREGQPVLLPSQVAEHLPARKVRANLRYLDVATVLHLWDQWRLGPLLDDLLPPSQHDISVTSVIQALVAQRCVAPDSKLQAQRWYPRTALPELQGVLPGKLNNTRIHRALDLLETVEEPLQERLTRRLHRGGAFTAVYLDITDTWFCGRGPELAHKARTKDGVVKRRVGIVLLCDARGYPLRWATVPGNHHEASTMMAVLRKVTAQPWMDQVPLVVDRAMGRGATVGALCAHDVRFVTAVPVSELPSYSSRIPLGAFDALDVDGAERDDIKALAALQSAAVDAGFERVTDDRYVLDLGILARPDAPVAEDPAASPEMMGMPTRSVTALRVAHRLQEELDAHVVGSQGELAARWGCSERGLRKWRSLLKLTDEVQQAVVRGDADRLNAAELYRIAALPPDEQSDALQAAKLATKDAPICWPNGTLAEVADRPRVRVRGVVLFNPGRFLEQRLAATNQLHDLEAFVADLNRRLCSPHSRRSRDSVLAAVGREIHRRHWAKLFDVHVESVSHEGRQVFRVSLQRDDEAWAQRRQTDGLTLIVTHTSVPGTAAQVVDLYFAKDMVEKDFQTIKSVLELRPVRHRTDAKVRAHVTLCMLALLLERTLERQLHEAGIPMTAATALGELATCHLNLYADSPSPTYSVTETTPDQQRIIAALGREDLASDATASESLTPR